MGALAWGVRGVILGILRGELRFRGVGKGNWDGEEEEGVWYPSFFLVVE